LDGVCEGRWLLSFCAPAWPLIGDATTQKKSNNIAHARKVE
jgi:hypothetical protein